MSWKGVGLSFQSGLIEIRDPGTPSGRGVFARESIPRGAVLEVCPVVFVFSGFHSLNRPKLSAWELYWDGRQVAMAGGHAHFYNHGDPASVSVTRRVRDRILVFRTKHAVRKDEELLVHYECPLWFKEDRPRPGKR